MDKIRNTKNYLSDKTKSKGSQVSKETNKQIAKDSNVGVTTRARAAGNALLDKMDQSQHSTTAEMHKQAAKH